MRIVSKEYFSEHPKYIRLFAKIGILILGLVFLLLIGILRDSELPIGDKPYYHLFHAGQFSGVGAGWNFILGYFPLNILLFIAGLLSIFFIFLNLEMLKIEERLVALGFFIISPAFLYLFNVGERFGIAFLFSLIASYFFLNKKYLIAALGSALIFLIDIWIGMFVLFLFALYLLYINGKKRIFYALIGAFIFLTLLLGDFNRGIISDLGAKIGSSVFALFFVIFCFSSFWNRKKFLFLYGVSGLLFLFSLKVEFGIFYFSLVLSLLMSFCFLELFRIKWESKLVRDFILLIVVCGLLFSGLSYMNRVSKEKPDQRIFNALERLPEDSVVFSDIGYGNWILFSGKRAVWDSFMDRNSIRKIEGDFSAVFESQDYLESTRILEEYGVDYILIDNELRERGHGAGLLYLLKYNSEDFRLLFDEDGVEAWRFFR